MKTENEFKAEVIKEIVELKKLGCAKRVSLKKVAALDFSEFAGNGISVSEAADLAMDLVG